MRIRKSGPIVVAIAVPALVFVLLLVLASSAGADQPEAPSNSPPVPVPYRINYQGRLLDDTGAPINGTVNLIFRLYTDPTSLVWIWDETHNGVSVSDGYFDVLLGETNPLGQNYFIGDDSLYLEVVVGGETLSPRQQIASVAYAIVANTLVPGAEISGEGSGGTFGEAVLNIDNTAPSWDPSHALFVRTASGSAVHAESGNVALYGHSDTHYGLYVTTGATSHSAGYFESTDDKGIVAKTSGTDWWDWAGWFVAEGNGPGIWSESENGYGIYAKGGFGSEDYGGYFVGWRGVWADAVGGIYGLYTNDKVYAGSGYVDIAEHIDVASDVQPGDVVVIDPRRQERVVKSTQPYDTAVAGIISTDPAILIGKSDSPTPLSLAGRVPCKVSAENGPILPGDLLTTSSTPGHAMKAEPVTIDGVEIYPPGTILGKALESLEDSTGLIMVLVTLQ